MDIQVMSTQAGAATGFSCYTELNDKLIPDSRAEAGQGLSQLSGHAFLR
jgi:hypothetical protein